MDTPKPSIDNMLGYWIEMLDVQAERLKSDKLREMAVEIYNDSLSKDEHEVYRTTYGFLLHLTYRAMYDGFADELDKLYEIVVAGHKQFRIGNYSYKSYLWAIKHGIEEISNNEIVIPLEKIPAKLAETFHGKAENPIDGFLA